MTNTTYTLNPIGRVAVDESGFSVVIDKPFRDALTGLDGFSRVALEMKLIVELVPSVG